MPDLRIHEYATRRELFEALPDTDVIAYDRRLHITEVALDHFKRLHGEFPNTAWICGDLVFVGEGEGE